MEGWNAGRDGMGEGKDGMGWIEICMEGGMGWDG